MSQTVTFNGVSYVVPNASDPPGWGATFNAYLVAIAAGAAGVNVVNTFTHAQTMLAPLNLTPTTAPTANANAQVYQDSTSGQLTVLLPNASIPSPLTQVGTNGVFRLQNLASAPASPQNGQIYYDTTLNVVRIYANSAWWALTLP